MLYYKDFVSGKLRRTYAKPVRIQRGGPLNEWMLVCQNRASILFIPRYCLTGASVTWFNELKRKLEATGKETT